MRGVGGYLIRLMRMVVCMVVVQVMHSPYKTPVMPSWPTGTLSVHLGQRTYHSRLSGLNPASQVTAIWLLLPVSGHSVVSSGGQRVRVSSCGRRWGDR